MTAKERLIVALDVDSLEKAKELIDMLSPEVDIFKIGIAPFTGFGGELLEELSSRGKKVFLDLKFHDIPNTVRGASREAARKNVFMMNFHCLGGEEMLKAASEGAREGGGETILLGVTILTSMDKEAMSKIGLEGEVEGKVLELAGSAKRAGLNGVVASAKEAREIKKKCGEDFIIVAPGIRPEWSQKADQKRTLTPKEAIEEGADYIVVGRPILQAEDPLEAARKIINEMEGF